MPLKILGVTDSMIRKAWLPYRQLGSKTKRKSSLDELNSLLQRNLGCGSDQCVEVVRHDHEIMKKIFSLTAVMLQNIDEQITDSDALE